MSDSKPVLHTEVIELPSKGWFYAPTHPLSSGKVEMKYMTAAHEDLLTTRSLIQKGIVLDKLLDDLIVNKQIKQEDLLLGDKNALLIAARIMGYGKDYPITAKCTTCDTTNKMTVNLEKMESKKIEFLPENKGKNEFQMTLPISKATITFQLPTAKSFRNIEQELDAMQQVTKTEVRPEVTARMRNSIIAINGSVDPIEIRTFVQNMPVRDAQAFREYVRSIAPDIDMIDEMTCSSCGQVSTVEVPIGPNFFWPNARV